MVLRFLENSGNSTKNWDFRYFLCHQSGPSFLCFAQRHPIYFVQIIKHLAFTLFFFAAIDHLARRLLV